MKGTLRRIKICWSRRWAAFLLTCAWLMVSVPGTADSRSANSADTAAVEHLAAEVRGLGWICFAARSEAGDWDLFVSRPDGSGRRNLTNTPQFDEFAPQFSGDNHQLLYRRLPRHQTIDGNRYGAQGELVIAASDGSNPRVIGEPGRFAWASWSPNGQQVASLSLQGVPRHRHAANGSAA